MKYCTHCGSEIVNEAVICVHCGCETRQKSSGGLERNASNIQLIKVFLVIGCVLTGVCGMAVIPIPLIPLAWCIPMTVILFGKYNNGETIGTGWKVCTLLFLSLIAGILMLCMRED